MYSVYVLSDPRTERIRYVGISCDINRRYRAHLSESSCNPGKQAWIQELKGLGLTPAISTLESGLSLEAVSERELYWINHCLEQGVSLLNIAGVTGPWAKEHPRTRKPQPFHQPTDQFLTVKEVAIELRVSEETVKRMLRRKQLPGRKVSNVWRIPVDRYKEWKKQQPDLSEGSAQES